jgi:hypothetical protein
MWNKKKNLLKQAKKDLIESREAFEWAFKTARRLIRLNIPIEFDWEEIVSEERRKHNMSNTGYTIYFGRRRKYKLDFLGKKFNANDKEDRARISGFLEHYEMLEKAKKKKRGKS